eukprot:SAG22_NODE_193_length_15643_cov_5.339424_4_plen_182_part_00
MACMMHVVRDVDVRRVFASFHGHARIYAPHASRERKGLTCGSTTISMARQFAEDYRGYIKHEVKPALDSIKDIVHAHFAAVELPSKEWLIETFLGHGQIDSPSSYFCWRSPGLSRTPCRFAASALRSAFSFALTFFIFSRSCTSRLAAFQQAFGDGPLPVLLLAPIVGCRRTAMLTSQFYI